MDGSGSEERCRDDTDSVGPPVRLRASADDDGVEQIRAELRLQPEKVPDVVIRDDLRELQFRGDDPAVGALHDQIDFLPAVLRTQVPDFGLRRTS